MVGAHYDHLGRVDGVVYPGADDNGSGTAVVLGLARAFAAAGGAGRTLVFAFFGAEELGLIGSRHYVNRPAVPLDRTVGMVNFDMVGRLQGRPLHVAGGDSGSRLGALVSDAAQADGVTLDVNGSPYGPSDHSRFYAAGVPVLFFSTGGHADYHRPGDTADKIDAAGMARVASVGARVIERLAAEVASGLRSGDAAGSPAGRRSRRRRRAPRRRRGAAPRDRRPHALERDAGDRGRARRPSGG